MYVADCGSYTYTHSCVHTYIGMVCMYMTECGKTCGGDASAGGRDQVSGRRTGIVRNRNRSYPQFVRQFRRKCRGMSLSICVCVSASVRSACRCPRTNARAHTTQELGRCGGVPPLLGVLRNDSSQQSLREYAVLTATSPRPFFPARAHKKLN